MYNTRKRQNSVFGKAPIEGLGFEKKVASVKPTHQITDTNAEIKKILKNTDSKKLNAEVQSLINDIEIVNERIVHIFEHDSNLFVDLSQCITLFERDFVEYPQKIDELISLVSEISTLPVPTIDEIPPIPVLEKSEIIDKPAWLVNAPLTYDFLVQQHKISESIELVVKCQNYTGPQVPSVSAWVDAQRRNLKTEIELRLVDIPITSEQAQKEIRQLQKLGYENDAMPLFLELASKSIDDAIAAIQNNGQILPYVEKASQALCNEVVHCVHAFESLFQNKYTERLAQWAHNEVSTKLPIARNDVMAGNFGFVREALALMREAANELNTVGISVVDIFDGMPARIVELLEFSARAHISEIQNGVEDDEWDIDLSGVRTSPVSEYPLAPCTERFKSHLAQFCTEIEYLYEQSIYFDCTRLLKEVILSFPAACMELLRAGEETSTTYLAVMLQLSIICSRILAEPLKAFKKVTGCDFSAGREVEESCAKSVDEASQLHISSFIQIWSYEMALPSLPWNSIEELDPDFETAVESIREFMDSLKLPQDLYSKSAQILLQFLLDVIREAGEAIATPEQVNCFDFSWSVFARACADYFSKDMMSKFMKGVSEIVVSICKDNGINDNEHMTPFQINQAVEALFTEDDYDE